MQKCPDELETLPDHFPELTVEEALQMLLELRVIDANTYFACKQKQEDEARWIRKQ